jgi:hypothetical protein
MRDISFLIWLVSNRVKSVGYKQAVNFFMNNYLDKSKSSKSIILDRHFNDLLKHTNLSKSLFDIIEIHDDQIRKNICERSCVLDLNSLEEYIFNSPNPMGAVNLTAGSRFSQKIAWVISQKIAQNMTHVDTDSKAFAEAWFFTLWTEMTSLIPIRHFARKFSKEMNDKLILIPLRKKDFNCFGHWNENELTPLLLATSLRRYGAKVILLFDLDPKKTFELQTNNTLNFKLSNIWNSYGKCFIPDLQCKRILVAQGIVNSREVATKIGSRIDVGSIQSDYSSTPTYSLWSNEDVPQTVSLKIHKQNTASQIFIWSPDQASGNLFDLFLKFFGPLTQYAWEKARQFVARSHVHEAHICDHHFFSSALVAHATSLNGGDVVLWPHSTNAVHSNVRDKTIIRRVTTITKSASALWKNSYSQTEISIKSDLMLDKPNYPNLFQPDQTINIIIFAGAHRLLYTPLINVPDHKNTWNELISALALLNSDYNVTIKPKDPWESETWIRQFLPQNNTIKFTNKTSKELQLTNMIYLSVSYGSSALLEGMGRNIPCMIVRNTKVEDYTSIDSNHTPIGNIEYVLSKIYSCRDSATYNQIIDDQRKWFLNESHFF